MQIESRRSATITRHPHTKGIDVVKNVLKTILTGTLLTLTGCASTEQPHLNLVLAERFIDAFYSWSPNALSTALAKAPADANRTLYYQAWAEAGDYQIQTRRACIALSPTEAECAITVTDDIGAALGYVATDTFKLRFADNNLVGVQFTSDDPPVLQELFTWLENERPQIFTGPCKDLFAGGTTPAACIRAVVQGAKDYRAANGG